MSFFSPRNSLLRILAFGIVTALGCAGEDGEAGNEEPELASWQPAISEESGHPASCPNSAIDQIFCRGKYCDDLVIHCSDTVHLNKISSRWLPPVSEESEDAANCYDGEVMSGVSCSGKYCDNVSIECSRFEGLTLRDNHRWSTQSISEELEFGVMEFSPESYPIGLYCMGKYCDDITFFARRMDIAR